MKCPKCHTTMSANGSRKAALDGYCPACEYAETRESRRGFHLCLEHEPWDAQGLIRSSPFEVFGFVDLGP